MIRIGQEVTVVEDYSLLFRGMTGVVTNINPNSFLPIQVQFEELNNMAYWFSEDELEYEPSGEDDEEEIDY
jgi:hypothetical protein